MLIAVAFYVALFVVTTLPACQRWTARSLSAWLTDLLGSDVSIGAARIGPANSIVATDVLVRDQHGDTLLAAARLSGKVDLVELTRGRVRLPYVQLFGYDIRLRRDSASAPYNFQHIVDRLQGSGDGPSATDVAIESILIRRGRLSHHIGTGVATTRFTPEHFCLDSLSLRAHLGNLTDSTLSIDISRLSLCEKACGLALTDGSMHIERAGTQLAMSDVVLLLPHSTIAMPTASLLLPGPAGDSDISAEAKVDANLHLPDLAALYPPLATWHAPIALSAGATLHDGLLTASATAGSSSGMALAAAVELLADSVVTLTSLRSVEISSLQLQPAFTDEVLQWLAELPATSSTANALKPIMQQAGALTATAAMSGNGTTQQATLSLDSEAGSLTAAGTLTDSDSFTASVRGNGLNIAAIAGEASPLSRITLDADIEGHLAARSATATVHSTGLTVMNRHIAAADARVSYAPASLTAAITVDDPAISGTMTGEVHPSAAAHTGAPLWEQYDGHVALRDIVYAADSTHLHLDSLVVDIASGNAGMQRHISIEGDGISAHADGRFTLSGLQQAGMDALARALPSIMPAHALAGSREHEAQDVVVDIRLSPSANALLSLAGIGIELGDDAHLHGRLDNRQGVVAVSSSLPRASIGGNDLRQVSLSLIGLSDDVTASLSLQRMVKSGPVAINVSSEGHADELATSIIWDNHQQPAMRGEVSTTANIFRSEADRLGANIVVHPSQVVVQDTAWHVQTSTLTLHDGVLDIYSLHAAQMGRSLDVSGRISDADTDTLHADLHGINLQYVFGMLNFHDLEFAGHATGHVAAYRLAGSPAVDAQLRVPDFSINGGSLSELNITGGFGRQGERAIDLDAYITEPRSHATSRVLGIIKPGRAPGRGLDLDIAARHLDISFLNSFTHSFMTDLEGNASGHARVYGPFAAIDLEGDLMLDTLSASLDYLGHRYHANSGDSIHLRPGRLYTSGLTLCDAHHRPSRQGHTATMAGEVQWEHFKNIRYDFDITADDVLGYDFRDFGDEVFCGTILARGNVHIAGQPGSVNIDLTGSPAAGSTFTYNATSPETLTDAAFITFTPRRNADDGKTDKAASSTAHDEDQRTDLHLNFDIDMTQAATIRLLMDARSDDYITLHGDGHLRATYYNKGRFQMYGTYRVDHGSYRLSLQDVIRKDFQFERGGTIVFGGTPMNADLNLRAIYTLPSVSLNELATGANFSSSNVRVNCLMDITGQASAPQVAFDFDLPNVNEDEKQMVRSLISTEEERNMQVIYLLGIGRFYTYEYAAEQSQTGTAMNGLLSSTLSGQLNDLLTNAIGSNNWSFGTNLTTGQAGWSNVDVEGMLSGRLLNNRLLINGTFGYRDTPIANNNFIGDFDVQWYLTPSGGLSLKAYSETNDRYFTKSALTTQGIGVQVRRDFHNLPDFFRHRQQRVQH